MFSAEVGYARSQRKSQAKAHLELYLDGQRHWRPDEPSDATGISLPGRCVYAQNDAYLELCNPGWDVQWRVVLNTLLISPFFLFVIWGWYGFTLHPMLFGEVITFWDVSPYEPAMWPLLVVGWGIGSPLALGSAFLLYGWFFGMGMRSVFFTSARGRIRFNRLTRKVYVLRPGYCGGNKVFEWDGLVALAQRVAEDNPNYAEIIGSLTLYQAPSTGKPEDAFFVGPSLYGAKTETATALWEYIRLYMQDGPTEDRIPHHAPRNHKKVPRYLPPDYSTYCGKTSVDQYNVEEQPGFTGMLMYILSAMTCSWARFPEEWHSDSGLGEPEDRPVQTGAVMTALVYRAAGKLSKEDELEFLKHWGTDEASVEAHARTD